MENKNFSLILREEKKITCFSCGQAVITTLIPYGNGRIATCPHCQKLAYNGQ